MADVIIDTDPRSISRDIIQSVEAELGPMMPGDERRIFLDQLAYVFAVQNNAAAVAWAHNAPETASGDALTALGLRIGVERSAGRPARVSLSASGTGGTAEIAIGTRLSIGGVAWAVTSPVSLAQPGEAEAEDAHPSAGQTSAQNAIVPGMEATPLSGSLPLGILSVQTRSVGVSGCYLQTAVCDDRADDSVFRERVIAYQRRSFDWTAIARRVIPDAADVYAYLAEPGAVRIVAVKRDADGWTRALTAEENTALTAALQSCEERPLGDEVASVVADVQALTATLTVTLRRGWLASVTAAATAAVEKWCLDGAGHLGGEVDSGDLVRILDGIEGVRWVNVRQWAVGALPARGTPPHVALTQAQASRCTPAGITIEYTEA